MDLPTILAASEEAHRSEAPFFIAGALLAIFAVIVSVIGFTRPQFPARSGESRAVMGIGTVLVLATAFTSVYVAL